MKTPNPKRQIPEKFQILNTKTETSAGPFGAWILVFFWCLVFGV
jgi:hypothetical protein